jgi:hypothetical protein
MSVTEISLDIVAASFDYDPNTGVIVWRDRPWIRPCVNARVRGKRAGKTFDGYNRLCLTVDGVGYYLLGHRVAWALFHGNWPQFEIDHADGNGLNNRIKNLRSACSSKNKQNRATKLGQTPYKGVSLDKRRGVYNAKITLNRKTIYLGSFGNPVPAAKAYDSAAIHYFGEFAKTNEMLGLL